MVKKTNKTESDIFSKFETKIEDKLDSLEVVKRKYTKKKVETRDFSVPGFVSAKIMYTIVWKCPKCKKDNSQIYKNIYHTTGPEWSAKSFECKNCKYEVNVIDDPEE